MSFRAKRLRVQLPCAEEGSLVEVAEEDLNLSCQLTPLDYCGCSANPPTPPPPPPCCFGTGNCATYFGTIETAPPGPPAPTPPPPCPYPPYTCENTYHPTLPVGRICDDRFFSQLIKVRARPALLVEPEHLPLLRMRLEARLAEIDAVAQVARRQVEAGLHDIESAERALREREARDQQARDQDGEE